MNVKLSDFGFAAVLSHEKELQGTTTCILLCPLKEVSMYCIQVC